MNHVEASIVPLTVRDDTRTPHVTPTSDEDDVARVELDKVRDFVLLKVELDGVVRLDQRVGVADRAPVVSDDVGDALGANSGTEDLAELVARLLGGDAVDRETALDIIQQPQVLAGLVDRDNIHEAGWEGLVGADTVVDLDETLLDDSGYFTACECVLEAVAEEDGERKGFPKFVGTGRRTGSL